MSRNDRSHLVDAPDQGIPDAPTGDSDLHEPAQPGADPIRQTQTRSVVMRWFIHDIPYIAMLLLALVGVVLGLPVIYWIMLTPVFGIITIIEGWRKSLAKTDRFGFVVRVVLDWCALLFAIYLLYTSGVQGVMNSNSSSLGMMLLLGLGTFVAGIQARVWQICAIGGVLFLAVPSLGWLDQSPLLLTAAAIVIVVLGGFTWWVLQLSPTAK